MIKAFTPFDFIEWRETFDPANKDCCTSSGMLRSLITYFDYKKSQKNGGNINFSFKLKINH